MINTNIKIEDLNKFSQNSMGAHIGIEFTEINKDFLSCKMPVDHRTRQPYGVLHGGASVTLAEELGSTAANLCLKSKDQYCVGLDINANHIRSVKNGTIFGKAKPIHLGKKTQIWEIKITNEEGELVCISRLTMAVLDKSHSA